MRVQALIVDHGRILMRRHDDESLRRGVWRLPGGRCRDGEGPEEALERCLAEEAGLIVEVERLVVMEEPQGRDRRYTFAARVVDGELRAVFAPGSPGRLWQPAAGYAWRPVHPETPFGPQERKYLQLVGMRV